MLSGASHRNIVGRTCAYEIQYGGQLTAVCVFVSLSIRGINVARVLVLEDGEILVADRRKHVGCTHIDNAVRCIGLWQC